MKKLYLYNRNRQQTGSKIKNRLNNKYRLKYLSNHT